jgi:hypothetical protein
MCLDSAMYCSVAPQKLITSFREQGASLLLKDTAAPVCLGVKNATLYAK